MVAGLDDVRTQLTQQSYPTAGVHVDAGCLLSMTFVRHTSGSMSHIRHSLRPTALPAALFAVSLALASACSTPESAATPAQLAAKVVRDSVVKDSTTRARQDSVNRTLPGYVVDSIFPVEEMQRRFRAKLGGAPVTAFAGGSPSRDALVQRFIKAVVAADSLDLRAMQVSIAEFAYLVYPDSPNTKPPYTQDPALVWRTIQNPSESGFIRLVRRAGGVPVSLLRYRCDPTPTVQGDNRFWTNCELQLRGEKGDASTHRFFGNIIERDRQFKFMSYKNEF